MSGNGVHQEMMIWSLVFIYAYNVERNLRLEMATDQYIEFTAVEVRGTELCMGIA